MINIKMNLEDLDEEIDSFTIDEHLQLAAELGKTLLERNKELESLIKDHKTTIDEQEQEIVYLKKHTTALREVNDSRLKVYEQLEVGIQELERANHRLLIDNTNDKKLIKTLTNNLETLEARCDDITKQWEDVRETLSLERRKNERLLTEKSQWLKYKAQFDLNKREPKYTILEVDNDINNKISDEENLLFQSSFARSNNNANSTGINSGNTTINDIFGPNSSSELSIIYSDDGNLNSMPQGNEEIIRLVKDLENAQKAYIDEQHRCGELEEQLVAIIQENKTLQSRIVQTNTNEELKSMHDELSILEEVRQGQMCSRCLRTIDDRMILNDEQSSIAPTEECEEDNECRESTVSEYLPSSVCCSDNGFKIVSNISNPDDVENIPGSPNPYRDLVEKYEALLEVQRSSVMRKSINNGSSSLADELQSLGEFNQPQKLLLTETKVNTVTTTTISTSLTNCNSSTNGDAASSCNDSMTNESSNSRNKGDKNRGRTPTEFSEAETSSSGFSDETSNKYTQTEARPGYFLCSIGDGEDCKFSIYDDASPIDSRFRNRPEYRELFKEIFAVLKKAAENKEEGEKLPLLDDTHPAGTSAVDTKVPPVTPANEDIPGDFGDDAQSIISSAISEQSFAMSECITKLERKTAKKHIIEKNQENKPPIASELISEILNVNTKAIIENGQVLIPLKREPMEYFTEGLGIKKKNRRKNRYFSNDRSESPVALPIPPRIFVSGKKRRDLRQTLNQGVSNITGSASTMSNILANQQITTRNSIDTNGATALSSNNRNSAKYEWNGNTMVMHKPMSHKQSSGNDANQIQYKPSTASQDLNKLKKLDLSYAEVLRRADVCSQQHQQNQQLRLRNNTNNHMNKQQQHQNRQTHHYQYHHNQRPYQYNNCQQQKR